MKTVRQINIKNKQSYFFSDMINIKDFDVNLLNIDTVTFKSDDLIIYDIKYIKDLNSLNSLYLAFNNLDAYTEKDSENKYLVLASANSDESLIEKYTELWDEIKKQIKLITGNKVIECSKDLMKIKFVSDDDMPLDKILNIPVCVLIIRGVFKENSKYYSHECFYEYEYEENTNL